MMRQQRYKYLLFAVLILGFTYTILILYSQSDSTKEQPSPPPQTPPPQQQHQQEQQQVDEPIIPTKTIKEEPPHENEAEDSSPDPNPEWLSRVPVDFKACYLEEVTKQKPTSHLKKLAIVISTSPDRTTSKEFIYTTNNHKCYAKLNGYDWVQNNVNGNGPGGFFIQRHQQLLDKVLPNYQWVIHLDADSFFTNLTRSLDPFFVNRKFDVSMNMRMNGEAHSNYMVKNSPFGRCFLKSFVKVHQTRPGFNSDNGDIIQLVMDLYNEEKAKECGNKRGYSFQSYFKFIRCFNDNYLMQYTLKEDDYLPLKINWPRAGWWRTLENWGTESDLHPLYKPCWSTTDLIGHGHKTYSNWLAPNNDFEECNPKTVPKLNPYCKWITPETELEYAMANCVWSYPGCVRDGINICIQGPNCRSEIYKVNFSNQH